MATAVKAATVKKDPKPLQRVNFRTYNPKSAQNVLARQAATLLKYDVLAQHLEVPALLGRVLAELDIQPFSKISVEEYKTEQRKALRQRLHITYDEVAWRTHRLAGYIMPVPEFVLAKAVQIAKKVPKAAFFVESLEVERDDGGSKDYDPFLVVRLERESYYIEVWDEPKFESQLIDK